METTEKINENEVALITEKRTIYKREQLETEKKSVEERLLLLNKLLEVFR